MTERTVIAPLARLLTRKEAAGYCGLTEDHFTAKVAAGTFPPPIVISQRTLRWDVKALDVAIDRLGGNDQANTRKKTDLRGVLNG